MGGIYFHIPFCRRKCLYCNFFSTADVRRMPQMCDAMRRELIDRAASWPHRDVRTVYFGGGTPSLLPAEDIAMFLAEVRRSFRLADDAEVTVEAIPKTFLLKKRPDGGTPGSIACRWACSRSTTRPWPLWGDGTVERMPSGRWKRCVRPGFENLTIDLIYGIPGRSDDVLRSDVGTALGLGVRHVSAYALTVEPGTALDVLIGRKRLPARTTKTRPGSTASSPPCWKKRGWSATRCPISHFPAIVRGTTVLIGRVCLTWGSALRPILLTGGPNGDGTPLRRVGI